MSDLSGVQGRNRLPLFERNCGRFDVPEELELARNKTEKILLPCEFRKPTPQLSACFPQGRRCSFCCAGPRWTFVLRLIKKRINRRLR